MTITRLVGCLMKGLASEKPTGAPFLEDYMYICIDTGDIYQCNSSVWSQVSGPNKTEELKNKTINLATNTGVNIVQNPFTSLKREGFYSPAITPDASLRLALKGFPFNAGTMGYSYTWDSTDGYIGRFGSSVVETVGYISNSTANIVSRMSWLTTLRVRCRTSVNGNTRQYVGFSSNYNIPSNSDSPLGSTDSGILVGFDSAGTNFSVYNNDGSGTAPSPTTFPITENTSWHNFDITMTNFPSIIVTLDDANPVTLTTRIPAQSTNLYMTVQMQNLSATTKYFDISKIRFSSNFV